MRMSHQKQNRESMIFQQIHNHFLDQGQVTKSKSSFIENPVGRFRLCFLLQKTIMKSPPTNTELRHQN